MVAALAENHLAYRGKLKDMCEFLGVGNTTSNTTKIKEAIAALEKSGDIKIIKDGYTWTITLSAQAARKSRVIKIRNGWIKAIQQYKCAEGKAVSWENILKVLVFLCADKTEIKRYDTIGKALNISVDTVKRAVWALDGIDFGDIIVKRKIAWLKLNDDEYKVIGQRLDIVLNFDE
jgi:hypothetical protein